MTTTIPLEPVDGVTIHTIMDNVSDALLANRGPALRSRGAATAPMALTVEGLGPDSLKAEHGFSALIELESNGTRRQILFDTGVSVDGAAENLRRLELSLKDVEAIVLSHGHYDHTMGLHGLAAELGRRNLPIVLHPEAWSRRRIQIDGREPLEIPTLSGSALRGAGFEIVEDERPSFLLDGRLLITGEVDRTTPYETGMARQEALHDGVWAPDPLIRDDQAVVLHVRDRGLLILTGCGHAGIINIVRHARRLTGVDAVYAVMGGFHLPDDAETDLIPLTCAALGEFAPQVIVPAHCTGWRAVHLLAQLYPDAFIQNAVGTRFTF